LLVVVGGGTKIKPQQQRVVPYYDLSLLS